MQIESFQLGAFMTNCYLLRADDGSGAVLVDAPDEIQRVIDRCDELAVAPQMLVNTHGHVDHMAGNRAVREHWPEIRIAIGRDDAPQLTNTLRNLSLMMGTPVKSPEADVLLDDGDTVAVGREHLEVLATPGHTPGGISLLWRPESGDAPVVLSGDALFAMGIGRTDFPGGNMKTLLRSIRYYLFALPDETIVYSGHGPATTIGQEKRDNPFL